MPNQSNAHEVAPHAHALANASARANCQESAYERPAMMDGAIAECIAERRPVSPLNRYRPLPSRTVAQKWRDEAMEHLAIRKDAR